MGPVLSAEELARRTGTARADLETWRGLGLLGADAHGTFPPDAPDRVRLIQLLLRRRIPMDDIVAWARRGELDRFVALVAAPPGPVHSVTEAADRLRLPASLLQAFAATTDFGLPASDEVTEEDLRAFECLRPALEAGLPESAVIELARVFADAMYRVAETEVHLFQVHVRRALERRGLRGPALDDAVWQASVRLEPLDEPALRYFHQRALRHAVADAAALELAGQRGRSEPQDTHERRTAIAFVDLASFTPLTEAMGDTRAAEVLARFSELARQATGPRDGHVVKQIGDAFMLAFPDAQAAVAGVLELERLVSAEEHFPAMRSGINVGPVLFRDGDYVGTTVNVAARLAGDADRHQILVGPDARREAGHVTGARFRPLGARRLRGLSSPVEVYELRLEEAAARVRLVDPVCGMELSPEEASVRLSSADEELAFCSRECLERWVTGRVAGA